MVWSFVERPLRDDRVLIPAIRSRRRGDERAEVGAVCGDAVALNSSR